MTKIFFLLSISTFLFQSSIMAQLIETHLWQDRVVLLISDTPNIDLEKQLNLFKKNSAGLKERKIVCYQITPKVVKKDGVAFFEKDFRDRILEKYQPKKNDFTFILIGLDGGEKMRSTKVVSIEDLFKKIDKMPLRRMEIGQ